MTQKKKCSGERLARILLLLSIASTSLALANPPTYPWLKKYNDQQSIEQRISLPQGFGRRPVAGGSFADWLRHLPLLPGTPPVHLYNRQLKSNQLAHAAVIDLDVGGRDLQQCADAVIRLRAEYFWSRHQLADIHFRLTSGDEVSYPRWTQGHRPYLQGNRIRWTYRSPVTPTYLTFRQYLNLIFAYAGTRSLEKELKPIPRLVDIQSGDVFIKGGSPGHAVMVVDIAWHRISGKKIFLLAQSYMPAQEMHLLRNPQDTALSPWYEVTDQKALITPEWTFHLNELRRFPSEFRPKEH